MKNPNPIKPVIHTPRLLALLLAAIIGRACAILVPGLAALGLAQPACAGWSYAPWTGDADSGINSALEYPVAVNCAGAAVTVNGVAFQANASSGANFSIAGDSSASSSGANVTGDSRTLANDFIYGGNPLTVTLLNLTPGATYETTFFSYGWEPSGRSQTFATGSDSLVLDQDLYGQGNGIRITYSFVASTSSKVFTITPAGGDTFHLSALANRKVTPATILSFGSNVTGSRVVISQPSGGAATIAWTVPRGTDVTSLAPTYTVTSGSGTPVSGSVRNFSTPQVYTVIDGATTNAYTVTVSYSGWSYAPWTGDADSGISSGLEYPVAVNTSGDAVTVNGVAFQAGAASGANFSIAGDSSAGSSGANITGNSRTLANAFIYGGNPLTVTLLNLTPGATYETTFFSYGWEPSGRIQTFATGSDSLVMDQNFYGQGNGIRITCTFVASASSQVFTITPVSGGTFHLSALANRKVTPATILSFGTNVVGSSAAIGKPVGGAGTIAWTVPYSANLATLAPTYTLTSGTGTPTSGSLPSPNFSVGPVTYTVTDGGTTNVYTVTATKAPPSTACEITSFNANLAGSRSFVQSTGPTTGTVVVSVPAGTTNAQLAALVPTLTLSPNATCVIPTPPLSLSAPVHYLVTAEDGVTTKDYTVTVVADAEAFRLFVVKTAATGLAAADYDYLSLVPVSRHRNNGVPAVFAIANESDFNTNIYLQDYLRRYRPTGIDTVNFSATIPNFTSSAINAAGPLELSVAMATSHWTSSAKVVLVSDAVDTANYPNVLQASALAAALDAPMIYYNAAKEAQVQNAITQLGATEVVYVNSAGTKPAMAGLVLTSPAAIVNYLAGKGVTVDYFAVTNPTDLNLVTCAKLSLTAPFVAARRTGIVVPEASWACNPAEAFHYTGYPAIKAELQQIYTAIGRYPSYLALVGSAHSIPLAYRVPNEDVGLYYGSPADIDYAEVDADAFVDLAIGRIMAYDIYDATLLTSRISTYEQLFDGVWEKTMADVGGQWNSAYQNVLGANYGFSSINLIQSLGATQPVEASFIDHNDHSSQHELGNAFDVWNSRNVLAPAAVFSHGCAVAAIDLDVANLLIANQMFKLGAVSFVGSTRLDIGAAKQMQSAMVNALFAGEPLGRGYLAAMDSFTLNGPDDQRWNYILLGDPGLRIHVPSAPAVPPANHVVTPEASDSAILNVNIPATLFTAEVDQTWCSHWGLTYPEYWGEKAGLYGADVERFYLVRQTIPRPVASVEELDVWPTVNYWFGTTKLGMVAQPTIDYKQDGTQQLVWAIRANIMDWPSSQSPVPLASMTNATFRIRYLSGKAITAFNANFPGSTATIQSLSDTTGTVVVYVPPGTTAAQIAALAPTYTLESGATCNQPNSAIPNPPLSLNAPVSYTVTPQDPANLPARVYSVIVTTNSPSFWHAPWTGDANSGITSASPYTVAVNFAGAATTVNGVAFQASALTGTNFSIGGGVQVVNGSTPNLTGNSLALGSDFIFNGNPRTVALLNLTPGKTYETTLFSYGWEASGRIVSFASGTESCVLDQDAYGAGNGIRIMHRFVATSSTKIITITPAAGATGSFHLCALANREVPPLPTLAASAIVDNKGGAPVTPNTLVTYTVTFSQDMDAATVTAADFGNAGSATVTIGAVTETSPGVFSVPVTPTSAGTLQLRVNIGAELKDVSGNALVTTSAIADDTTLTVNRPPVATPQSVTTSYNTAKAITLAGTDPDGSPLTYVVVTQPTKGTLTGTAPNLTYTPNTNYGGPDSFTFKVNDGTVDSSPATVSITVGLPLPWSGGDIGTGMLAGSLSYNAGTFTQAGSGTIGSTSDKLRFTYQTLSGDGEIIARISVLQDTGTSSRVGVMIRDSLAANSKQIFMGMTGTGAYRWVRRTTTGGTTSSTNSSTGTVPNTWVRLVRSGTTITAYKSTNGTSWTSVGSTTNTTFATTCYIGLAVSSGSDTTLNTSQFTNVTVVP